MIRGSGMGIIFGHEHWEMAVQLMIGIRQSISEINVLRSTRSLRPKDFTDVVSFTLYVSILII